jgi:hypothetical protein
MIGRKLGVPFFALAFVASAHAQTAACDDFKASLAARFESKGVRGYSLEALPAGAPTPSGAKAIGNCESGAYKIVYRRWGAARAASTPSAPVPASDASAERVQAAPSERASRSLAAPAPAPVPAPATPTATATRFPTSAPGLEEPAKQTVAAAGADASALSAARGEQRAALERPVAASATSVGTSTAAQSLAPRAIDFAAAHWPWLGALLLLPAMSWIWRAYLSPYDKDGLPRGPRL